jgi:hypothetical protein
MRAFLVIAASNAAADTQGFLHPRTTPTTVLFKGALPGKPASLLEFQLGRLSRIDGQMGPIR